MFNAQNSRSELAGAAEVQEDRRLKVDLPIDQVKHDPAVWRCGCEPLGPVYLTGRRRRIDFSPGTLLATPP